MKQARRGFAALTLSVRPQQRKWLSVTGQEQNKLQQILRKSLKGPPKPTLSFNIAIESVSFYAYYPRRNLEKSR